jgi:hypothetical protein
MLGHLKMSVDETIASMFKFANRVFAKERPLTAMTGRSRFPTAPLEAAFMDVIHSRHGWDPLEQRFSLSDVEDCKV